MNSNAIGIFGGTFDPFHNAHLSIARAFYKELRLRYVRLIPTGHPYHRPQNQITPAYHRLAMAKLAIDNDAKLIVDDREIHRARASYTVETLEELRNELGWHNVFWLLIGSDSLANLSSWKDWQRLFDLTNLAVVWRPGFSKTALPSDIRRQWDQRYTRYFSKSTISGIIHTLSVQPIDLSATMVRERLARQQPIQNLVTPSVMHYIQEHGLYHGME